MAQAHKAKTMMTMMASSVFTRLSSGGMTTEQLLCNITTDPENFSIKAPSIISITNTRFQEIDYHSKLSGLAGRCRTCRTCRGCSTCWPRARAGDGRLMLVGGDHWCGSVGIWFKRRGGGPGPLSTAGLQLPISRRHNRNMLSKYQILIPERTRPG